jgi:hypothetical protein
MSLISRDYISLEMNHNNLELLGFSRRHQRVLKMSFRAIYYILKDLLAYLNFDISLTLYNNVGVEEGQLSSLPLKCTSNRYQGSVGGL